MVKNKTSAEGSLDGTNSRGTYSFIKTEYTDPKPEGSVVYELSKSEASIARKSIIFNDYSNCNDLEFAHHYGPFTNNDKNEARRIRLAMLSWISKNSGSWPASYHDTIDAAYENCEKKLSDGNLKMAYDIAQSISNSLSDVPTGDTIDVSSLNTMILNLFDETFDKFPR
jgi:hypothetical protein